MSLPTVLGTPNPVTTFFDPNAYVPLFMPEQTISITAVGGIVGWVASVPQCLAFESVIDLVSALQSLGYAYTAAFAYVPFAPAAGVFGGGPTGLGLVPWLGISPVPFNTSNNPPTAAEGAFVINAGKYANFFRNNPLVPFIGSSFQNDLVADISMRMDAARNGNPNLG